VSAGPDTSVEPTSDGWRASSALSGAVDVDGHGAQADVRFDPLHVGEGDLFGATAGGLELRSRRRAGHDEVSLVVAPGRALRVEGVLDGGVRGGADLGGAARHDLGVTDEGPTSVHWRRECAYGTCVDIVEYDYDLTDPAGDGTTVWRGPGLAPTAVDRVRVLATASPRPPVGAVRLWGFKDLRVRD
jgi:hypothetical protein